MTVAEAYSRRQPPGDVIVAKRWSRFARRACAVLALAFALGAIGVGAVGTTQAAPLVESAESSPLVGRWQKVTTCQQIVDSLRRYGLENVAPAMVAGNGLVSGTPTELAAKRNLCEGAIPRVHSHFFTRGGEFGSLDWNLSRVDDGTYRVVDARRFRIGKALFRYRILEGKRLALTPVLSAAAKRQALARPLQFSEAGWMVAVALPSGGPWKRVPCRGWC
jgi:hypothetical protein